MNGYKEIEIKAKGGHNDGMTLHVNVCNINYYRDFIPDGGGAVDTQIYFANGQGLTIAGTPDSFQRKIKRNIDLSMLSEEDFHKVLDYARTFM